MLRSIVALVAGFGLFFLGLAGFAFALRFPGFEGLVFAGGLLSVSLAFWIPFNLLPMIEKPAN